MLLAGGLLYCAAGFAQSSSLSSAASTSTAPNVRLIKAWYAAWENKDWNSLQQVLADGFTFSSPLDDHINVAAVKERCWPNAYKIKRFDIDRLVAGDDIVFVITNGWTTDGKLFRNTDCFQLKNGKIGAYECFFGPGVNYPNSGK